MLIARVCRIALCSALLPLAVGACRLDAQTIDGRRIPLAVDTFDVFFSGRNIGRGIWARSAMEHDGRTVLLQVYRWRGAGGDSAIDSLFSDLVSLRSIREVRVVTDTIIEVSWRRDSVRVEWRPASGKSVSQEIFTGASSYSSSSLDAVVAASVLSEGFRSEHSFYFAPPASHGTIPIELRVTGSAQVRDGVGTERDAWIVEATTPGGGTIYWIDKHTRAVLQFDTHEGPAVIEFRR